jgi:hypothetical protein
MLGSAMFSVAYGLRFSSNNDPTLIRMEKLTTAVNQSSLPTQFLVVSIPVPSRYTHDESFESANLLERVSSFEAPPFLDAWWFIQEVG